MEDKYLHQVLPFLKDIDKQRRIQFEEYFHTAPAWLLDSCKVVEMEKGVKFVRENAPVDTIYFIGQGTIKATEYRIYGISYDFMRFDRVYAMGGMEIIMDLDVYRTTLETITPCTVVKIPKAKFEKWMLSDIRALKKEAKLIGEYLLEQGRNSRAYLFLQGSDRVAMLFTDWYEKYAKSEVLRVKRTRQEISDETGLCIKTINRAVKKFTDQQMISRIGNQVQIDKNQYKKLKEVVSAIIEPEMV